MCLKPQPPQPIPPDTKTLVGAMLDEDTVYRFVGDVLFEQFHEADFADLYPKDGQPALSPVLLSFVTIFQSLEDLSDRKTPYALRVRFDWKYALHLPPKYKGFDHTVLSEFRQRLLTHKAESRIFNAIFAQLKQLGFFKRKGIQHTDSIAVLSHHRLLHRIELCVETMRTTRPRPHASGSTARNSSSSMRVTGAASKAACQPWYAARAVALPTTMDKRKIICARCWLARR